MTQLIIGSIIALIGIYLQDSSYPLIGVIISIIGFSVMLRGRRKLDRTGIAYSNESKKHYAILGFGTVMLVIGLGFMMQYSRVCGAILAVVGLAIALKGRKELHDISRSS